MALIPSVETVATRIYAYYSEKYNAEPSRPYLGGSAIGNPCERALWYSFRWATKKMFEGRLLRLFQRGHKEEPWLVDDMRACGMQVWPTNPGTNKQWSWSEPATGHHFAGNGDGILRGVPEAPKAPHLWECKTHSTKSFNEVKSKGVLLGKPVHYSQMQIYMHWTVVEFGKTNGCKRALYTAVCKETDEIYTERIEYDEAYALALIAKANRIIKAETPLPKMSLDPTYYECKFCDQHAVCHGDTVPLVSCRTCVYATPELDGQARWTCGRLYLGEVQPKAELTVEQQRVGCEHHRLIPALLANWATPQNSNLSENWIEYQITGTQATFRNGAPPSMFTSAEIAAAGDKNALTAACIQVYRDKYDARIVS